MYRIWTDDECAARSHGQTSPDGVTVWGCDFIPAGDPVAARLVTVLRSMATAPARVTHAVDSCDIINSIGDVVGKHIFKEYIAVGIPQNAHHMARYITACATEALISAAYAEAEQCRQALSRAGQVVKLAGSLDQNHLKRGELKRLVRAALDATLTAAGVKKETDKGKQL